MMKVVNKVLILELVVKRETRRKSESRKIRETINMEAEIIHNKMETWMWATNQENSNQRIADHAERKKRERGGESKY